MFNLNNLLGAVGEIINAVDSSSNNNVAQAARGEEDYPAQVYGRWPNPLSPEKRQK